MALVVEYEGTEYHGFQYQKNASSIQEELEKAISSLTGENTRVKGAGRTDAGVHARAQVVAFDTNSSHPLGTFVRGLNHYLPDAIGVKAAYRTRSDFDPRRMALGRTYSYVLDCGLAPSPLTRRTAFHVGGPLNIRRMRRGGQVFVGRHDFASFAAALSKPGGTTVREVYRVGVSKDQEMVKVDVEGNSFLPRQVRRMVGALVSLGRGNITTADLTSMMEQRPGAPVAHALPALGLCLMKITYADFPPKAGDENGNAR